MLQKLYNKVFKSAFNFSLIKSFIINLFYFNSFKIKLFIGKRTSIINKGGSLLVNGKSFIDSKNSGQFFFDSHVILEKNSQLLLNNNVNFFSGAQIKCFENSVISIGSDTYFSGPVVIHSKKNISIGSNCSVSWGVTILDSDFHTIGNNDIKTADVIIGNNVWIGCNSTILNGVKITDGSIIASGSIVTKSIEEVGLYAGSPARKIKDL